MCPNMPASSSAAFPIDPFVMDGLSVHGAQSYSAAPRRLTIWGGTIQSISVPVHSGPTSGNSSGDIVVRFRSTGPAVLLAWGGHLAQSAYWNRLNGGPSDGAGQVSGSPWHMRTLQLDGAGNKNQDRSIQPSAIVGELPPFALAPPQPAPRPTPPGGGGGGNPPSTTGGTPGLPVVTIPPTSTLPLGGGLGSASGGLAGTLAGTLVTGGFAALAILPWIRRRRRP